MNRKGFTLIELLAVIVILAIIALITIPSVLNIIEDSRKSAVENSARNIARAAEIYYANNVLKNLENQSIDLEKDTLPYNGEKPEKGVVTYDSSGRAYIKMYMNGYCVSVSHNNELKTDKIEKDSCALDVIILSMDPNGGEVSEHSREYDNVGAIGELPTPTRVGYTFLGWTLKDGTEVDSTTEIKENVTIYASWEANTYEVTLNLNNGVVSDINTWGETYKKEIRYDTAYGSLPILEKEGYTFLGWYTQVGLNVIDTTLLKIADDHTLEAKYEANKYEVTFVYNDNVTEDTVKEVVFNSNYNLPNVTKTGYKFLGWYEENIKIEDNSVVKILENKTYEAKWEANKYNVTFKYNNGNEDTTKEVTYNSAYGEIPSPTKEGYNFLGWHTTGGVLVESTTIVQIAEDHTLNASWGVNSYLVTFDANGGSVTPANTEIAYGETYGSNLGELPTPTRIGYAFTGWYTDKTSGTVVTKDSIMNTASNHYIYARWKNLYEDGNVVYFDVTKGQECVDYHIDNSKSFYNGTLSTQTTTNQNGCLKFYIFLSKSTDFVNLLLDHDTSGLTHWNDDNGQSSTTVNGPSVKDGNVLKQLSLDTGEWVGTNTPKNYTLNQTGISGGYANYTINYSGFKARLITVQEIADIVGASNSVTGFGFNEKTANRVNDHFYFDGFGSTVQDWQIRTVGINVCGESGNSTCSKSVSEYAWLYDRSNTTCMQYGCLNNASMDGAYWTASASTGSPDGAWRLYQGGRMHFNYIWADGTVRPVIEVDKIKIK